MSSSPNVVTNLIGDQVPSNTITDLGVVEAKGNCGLAYYKKVSISNLL